MKNCSNIESVNNKCSKSEKGIKNESYLIPIEMLEIRNGFIVGIKEMPRPAITVYKSGVKVIKK
jgi:hypothetical protein